jgi:two-component system OmpR family response regulator
MIASPHDLPFRAMRATRADNRKLRALIVETEPILASAISAAFEPDDWDTRIVNSGREALAQLARFQPDVVILDAGVQDTRAIEMLQLIRAANSDLRVVMLSEAGSAENRLAALASGADDYLSKPFSMRELAARGHSLARRSPYVVGEHKAILRVGDLELDEDSPRVCRGGEAIDLTPKEFELLHYLMKHSRSARSRGQILANVWGTASPNINIVAIYISYLRRKIDDGRPPMIRTVPSMGYVIRPV